MHSVEFFVLEVADARGEAEPQKVAQREDVIRLTVRAGVMLVDGKFRFVIEKSVKNVCRVTDG